VRPKLELRFPGTRFAESAPQRVIENRFERPPGFSGEIRDAFGKIVVESQGSSHFIIMMPDLDDVKMLSLNAPLSPSQGDRCARTAICFCRCSVWRGLSFLSVAYATRAFPVSDFKSNPR
jgi:hypothetical protein